ncbi:MAG: GTP cyclohydrolase II [Rhodospirillaceae bacterium]|nr:GTP cyclohydrolase II [Rhodospirillaceae bacterium]
MTSFRNFKEARDYSSKAINIVPTDSSPAQTSVERAIGDLRRGAIIMLVDSTKRTAAIVQAAELATTNGLDLIAQIAGSQPSLVITNHRSAAIKLNRDPTAIVSISIPPDNGADFVQRLSNPVFEHEKNADQISHPNLTDLSIVPEPSDGIASKAIQLIKFSRLLPSIIFSRIPPSLLDRLAASAKENGLLLVDTESINIFPQLRAQRLVRATSARVPLADAENAELIAFRPIDGGEEHVAILIGQPDITKPVLVRLHSQCLTGDLLGSLRCDCGDQLRGAIKTIANHGSGVLVYLAQEGRDIGLVNKLRAYNLQDLGSDTADANNQMGFEVDERIYAPAGEILKQLGVQSVKLLTNNPDKVAQLASTGIVVVERVAHVFPSNPHNARYLKTKADKTGHLF